jgi:hypothetical protein
MEHAREGGRSKTTWAAVCVLAIAIVIVCLEAAHETLGLGGRASRWIFTDLLHNTALWLAAGLCLWGTLRIQPRGVAGRRMRVAWLLVALALAAWATGSTLWSLFFASGEPAPAPTVADFFWLAWYPLLGAAVVLLVRDRLGEFEVHRWIDGIVVMLATAALWVAVFLEPVAHRSGGTPVGEALAFAYPVGDLLLVGGTLGVFALMGWRPGRMWLLVGLGLAITGVADAASAVTAMDSAPAGGVYDAAWPVGALVVAAAAWQPPPERLERVEISGWRAIALPLAAQALGIAVQIVGYFHEIARSERLLTVGVLLIAMVQIAMTRPGRRAAPQAAPQTRIPEARVLDYRRR